MDNFIIIGSSIAGIFLFFIFMKKGKQKSDYYLILINVLFITFLLSDIWIKRGLTPINFIVQSLVSFYLFPVYISYGLSLINGNKRIPKTQWWIYIYAFVFTVFILTDFILISDYDSDLLAYQYNTGTLPYHFFYKSHKLFIVGGLIWFLQLLNHYQSKIKEYYSFIEPLQLNWLKNFTYIYLGINILSLFTFLAYNFGFIAQIEGAFTILNTALIVAIFYLSYNGIQQYASARFQQVESDKANESKSSPSDTSTSEKEKYKTSSLTSQEIEVLYARLVQLFEEEEIFLEPQLKVNMVANRLKTTSHRLSQTINTKAGKAFYDFVNEYRVEKLKERLLSKEDQQFTILSLGLDCGFNSKASLNRIFKQQTGQSPSQFQKTHFLK